MCIKYKCRGCKAAKFIYCAAADWNQVDPSCQFSTDVPNKNLKHKKCHACQTVEGAITILRHMVFQNPWLETEGLGGVEKRPQWEVQEIIGASKDAWGRNYGEEDRELLTRLKAMKLDKLDGREKLNEGHGIDETSDDQKTTNMSDTGEDEDEDIASDPQDSLWGSDEGTLASDGSYEVVDQ